MHDLLDFIRLRWLHVGNDSGLAGIYEAGGPDVKTIRSICEIPNAPQERRTDTRNKLAVILRFASWDDLLAAWRKKDVLYGIAIRLTPGAFETAKRESGGKNIDDWVSRAVVNAAKGK